MPATRSRRNRQSCETAYLASWESEAVAGSQDRGPALVRTRLKSARSVPSNGASPSNSERNNGIFARSARRRHGHCKRRRKHRRKHERKTRLTLFRKATLTAALVLRSSLGAAQSVDSATQKTFFVPRDAAFAGAFLAASAGLS